MGLCLSSFVVFVGLLLLIQLIRFPRGEGEFMRKIDWLVLLISIMVYGFWGYAEVQKLGC